MPVLSRAEEGSLALSRAGEGPPPIPVLSRTGGGPPVPVLSRAGDRPFILFRAREGFPPPAAMLSRTGDGPLIPALSRAGEGPPVSINKIEKRKTTEKISQTEVGSSKLSTTLTDL